MPVFKFRNISTGQAMPIPEGEFVVGRSYDAYVYVDDGSVSRNHARLLNNAEGFFIEDLGSSNGTAMRGAFITTRTKLEYGNTLHIGSVPFRVDPEVVGEVENKPSPPMYASDLASIRRATERIPLPGESGWMPKDIPADKLSAPEVSPTDGDADELNAITMRDPAPPAPSKTPQPQTVASPTPSPAQKAAVASGVTLHPSSVAAQPSRPAQPATQALTPTQTAATPLPAPRSVTAETAPSTVNVEAPVQAQGPSAIWFLVTFLAGLGTGLLIGLVFAKMFIEMGGKVAGLP